MTRGSSRFIKDNRDDGFLSDEPEIAHPPILHPYSRPLHGKINGHLSRCKASLRAALPKCEKQAGLASRLASVGTASSSKTIHTNCGPGNAAPGVRTVKLRYLVETNGPDTFTVVVLRGGVINNVTLPPAPTAPFRTFNVTITGTNLDNASLYF